MKYTVNVAFDGNFSANNIKMKRPDDDVQLGNGTGFMVTDAPYKAHLKVAKEIKEVCPSYPMQSQCLNDIAETNLPYI